jgi:hypothetical protein
MVTKKLFIYVLRFGYFSMQVAFEGAVGRDALIKKIKQIPHL